MKHLNKYIHGNMECPECGRPMVIRTAKNGRYAGNKFWGCSGYPKCRGIVNIPPGSLDDGPFSPDPPVTDAGGGEDIDLPGNKLQPNEEDRFGSDNKSIRISYEAVPYNGFNRMRAYDTLGYPRSLDDIINDDLMQEHPTLTGKFRVDCTKSDGDTLNTRQRQIASLALRFLCRGNITPNSNAAEQNLGRLIASRYTADEICSLTRNELYKKSVDFSHDSELEKFFAETILYDVFGESWPLYTDTQVLISSLIDDSDTGDGFMTDQRVDFLITYGGKALVIELDGPEHIRHEEKDAQRDKLLSDNGYEVKRFLNAKVSDAPEDVADILKLVLDPSAQSHAGATVTDFEMLLHKSLHQIQIAVLSTMIQGVIDPNDKLNLHFSSAAFDEELSDALLSIALDDLREMLSHFCRIYGEQEFFVCRPDDNADVCICIGEPDFHAKRTVLISDISSKYHISNYIQSYRDLNVKSADDASLRYFLKYVFGFDDFREGQTEGITRLLEGKDSIVLLPTGSGKSLIYQLSSLIVPGKIVVISPLISLIHDQLQNLHDAGIDCALSIVSARRSSDLAKHSKQTLEKLNDPAYTMMYISPERLQVKTFRNSIDTMHLDNKVFAVAIDEAHCVSEWGHDFRTAYLNIGRTSRKIFNVGGHVPAIIALTGTASSAVLKDVKRELEITDYEAIITPETFDRKELNYKVITADSDTKQTQLKALLNRTLPNFFNDTSGNFYKINNRDTNCGIVFCPHVNGDFGICSVLNVVKSANITSDIYSGKAPKYINADWDHYKRNSASAFKRNEINTLIATKAFGMGIDKPNVLFTIHYGIPSSLESFYQEAGRAGRGADVRKALCVIILSAENLQEDNILLDPSTSLEQVNNIMNEYNRYTQDDISRMMFFHTGSFKGINYEMGNVNMLLEKLFESNDELSLKPVILNYGNDRQINFEEYSAGFNRNSKKDDQLNDTQKALQRLLVLGIVSDYTVDYSAREITVFSGSADYDDIREKYRLYVKGYNEGRVKKELGKLNGEYPSKFAFALNAARVLTDFIYDTIEKGRRRGLREMRNAAIAAVKSENPDKTLRQRIIRYFETVYADELNNVLESAEHGFDIIPRILDGSEDPESGERIGGIKSSNEASGLRGGVSRFLESTPDHPGLLMLRGLSELMCVNHDADSIKEDIRAACHFAIENYSYPEEDLRNSLHFCMEKVLDYDKSLFCDIADAVDKYVDKMELCSTMIDSAALEESKKAIPAEMFFRELASQISTAVTDLQK